MFRVALVVVVVHTWMEGAVHITIAALKVVAVVAVDCTFVVLAAGPLHNHRVAERIVDQTRRLFAYHIEVCIVVHRYLNPSGQTVAVRAWVFS